MSAIEIKNLTKIFGRGKQEVTALNDVNLSVPEKQVFGFLGPNGAGKTTTIRILMGLIRASQGEVRIFGETPRENPHLLKRVGAMVESPNFYEFMSGKDNLNVLANTSGNVSEKRIDELLSQVGLAEYPKRLVSQYSLGMKQRLGIAAALLEDPDLVLLDEPTNGLDPGGIQEMRSFIRSLAVDAGKTVFISSHLLYEIEQVCDQVAIINKGEIIEQGAIKTLLKNGQTQTQFEITPLEEGRKLLEQFGNVTQDGKRLNLGGAEAAPHAIARSLIENGIEIHQMLQKQPTLEEYFINLTGEKEV